MIRFFERLYPSANSVLLLGPRPALVDTGFGSDADETLRLLGDTAPALIVNTHFHTDHVGGNHAVRRRFATPVAASEAEAALVNRHDPDACEAAWLAQPIESYRVERPLRPGDRIETGASTWTVIATPGHTEGHLSLHDGAAGILVLGDALHHADVGWLSPLRTEALEQTAATLAHLAALPATIGYPGHGKPVSDLAGAFTRARRRLDAWRRDPQAIGWHACKRIFAHMLMLADGMDEASIQAALLARPWFRDHARLVFASEPADFVCPLIAEMVRADAAYWSGGKLVARAAYRPPPPGWLTSPGSPRRWEVTPPLPA